MGKNKKVLEQSSLSIDPDFVDHFWEKSWTYIRTVVDVVRDPVLILNKDLHVMAANESFYKVFQVEAKDTEQKIVYDLGNGQWDIPALRILLEDILPENTFFKGFEVVHKFPIIGPKVMILNARQIYVKDDGTFPQIILLAIEDVTEMMDVAESIARHTKEFEIKTGDSMERLGKHIMKLEEKFDEFKKYSGKA